MVAKIAARDDSEGANGGQRARLGTAQGVDAVTIANVLPLGTARQVYVTREDVARVARTLQGLTVTLGQSDIVSSAP